MKSMSEYLSELEGYPDVEAGIIKTTKINKVLKAMIKLPTIPLDEEYKFKDRSMKLLGIWQETLSKEPGAGALGDKDEDGKPGAAAPTTNGSTKPTEEESGKAEAEDAAAPEEEPEEAVEKKIGTTSEGEKEVNGKEEDSQAKETEKVDDIKGDEPDIEHEPSKEYHPPAVEAAT